MAQVHVSQIIHIIFDGTNYSYWAQVFQNFLRGHKIWKYVTSSVTLPIAVDGELSDKFNAHFEE